MVNSSVPRVRESYCALLRISPDGNPEICLVRDRNGILRMPGGELERMDDPYSCAERNTWRLTGYPVIPLFLIGVFHVQEAFIIHNFFCTVVKGIEASPSAQCIWLKRSEFNKEHLEKQKLQVADMPHMWAIIEQALNCNHGSSF